MGILNEDIARVREATDIVQLITNQVALRRAGRRWQGLCPFHTEKSPSFSVNAEEGLYYCFGCRASGDAISFVRQTEGLDFVASVELLAARAGITLRYDSKGEAADHGRRRKLVDVVGAAVEWYHERLLTRADAGAARHYLRSRGVDGDEVRAFKMGWAPGGWDELSRSLRKKASSEVLIEAGLAYLNKFDKLTDNFRARVLFPVFDVRGDPVGFGGRILPGTDGPPGPKYKNSPETPVYAKSRLLYGLNWAKEAMVRQNEVIVCEGYTDVIGLHAAGLPQAVATCGTSLTEDHVKTMRRFAPRIVLAFDADTAGGAAAERIYQWESAYELDVYVADLPDGSDPDDLARSDPDGLRAAVAAAKPFLTYRIDRALERANMATAEGRVRAAAAALAVVDEHPFQLVRDEYLMKVADRCHLNSERLRETVESFRSARRGAQRRGMSPDGGAVAAGPGEPTIAEQILLLRMHAPEKLPAWVTPGLLASDVHRRIFGLLADGVPLRDLQEVAKGDAAAVLARLAVLEPPENPDAVIGRFMYDAATRRIDDIPRAARTAGDASVGPRFAEMQLARGELQAGNWSSDAAEKLARLLDDVPGNAGQDAAVQEAAGDTGDAAPAEDRSSGTRSQGEQQQGFRPVERDGVPPGPDEDRFLPEVIHDDEGLLDERPLPEGAR